VPNSRPHSLFLDGASCLPQERDTESLPSTAGRLTNIYISRRYSVGRPHLRNLPTNRTTCRTKTRRNVRVFSSRSPTSLRLNAHPRVHILASAMPSHPKERRSVSLISSASGGKCCEEGITATQKVGIL